MPSVARELWGRTSGGLPDDATAHSPASCLCGEGRVVHERPGSNGFPFSPPDNLDERDVDATTGTVGAEHRHLAVVRPAQASHEDCVVGAAPGLFDVDADVGEAGPESAIELDQRGLAG